MDSLPEPDIQIITSSGLRIPAHSGILASVSPVLENMIDRPPRKHRGSGRIIPILGVPCEAVSAFVEFVYSSRCSEEQLDKYGIHLLALSHVYLIPQLKQICIKAVRQQLTVDNVVDVLKLGRLCDAPDLCLKCMKMISSNFKAVEHTDGWKFIQDHDPWLELHILQFIDEAESRKQRRRRHQEEQGTYLRLSEAMECLEHIYTEGCTSVGPYYKDPMKERGPCGKFGTCEGIQDLIKHFAACKIRSSCSRCKRMWQLLRLHSNICDKQESCKVPLCRQFKLTAQLGLQGKRRDETRWRLLVRKVVSAKTISSLSLLKRKREMVVNNQVIKTCRLR